MAIWGSLSLEQRVLMRCALRRFQLVGTVQHLAAARRWAGIPDVGAWRSYSEDEERALIPTVAAAASSLIDEGWLLLRERQRAESAIGRELSSKESRDVLADVGQWLSGRREGPYIVLDTAAHVRGAVFDSAFRFVDVADLPTWEELGRAEREVLVCASEFSGYLTGAFGIWDDPPEALAGPARLAWVEQQIAPLLPYVRKQWIEVRRIARDPLWRYDVIPLEGLSDAFADPEMRYQGDEWGIGLSCVFTDVGYSVWLGGWSQAWGSRLRFD